MNFFIAEFSWCCRTDESIAGREQEARGGRSLAVCRWSLVLPTDHDAACHRRAGLLSLPWAKLLASHYRAPQMTRIDDITATVKQAAKNAGFELAGIAPVGDFSELRYFPEWVASGYAGEMKYLESRHDAGDLKRASLRTVAPWARSVVVCAINYNTDQPY